MIPLPCAVSSAAAICRASCSASTGGRACGCSQSTIGRPVDVLHDQKIRADVVNLADVGMIECGDGFGFTRRMMLR